jgi:predicted nucleic acid-binding protein
MKAVSDTNVVVPALLFPQGIPAKVLARIQETHRLIGSPTIAADLGGVIARSKVEKLGSPRSQE